MLLIKQIKNLKFACEKHKKIKRNDMSNNTGKVSQIIGPVVDVVFDNNENELPNIYDSLEITRENGSKLVLECQQHIGEDTVRAIAMETTDGISRGVDVVATGAPIMMPAGENIKGRVFNVPYISQCTLFRLQCFNRRNFPALYKCRALRLVAFWPK